MVYKCFVLTGWRVCKCVCAGNRESVKDIAVDGSMWGSDYGLTCFSAHHGHITTEGSRVPANTRRSPNVGTMLDQRRRRWSNIVPTLGECFRFAGESGLCNSLIESYRLQGFFIVHSTIDSSAHSSLRTVWSTAYAQTRWQTYSNPVHRVSIHNRNKCAISAGQETYVLEPSVTGAKRCNCSLDSQVVTAC